MRVSPTTLEETRAAASAAPRLHLLTSLRFFAALLVFGRHITVLFQHSTLEPVVSFLLRPGAAGVSFFFILSGFVLTWSRPSGDQARSFWRRRFARIFPNHVVTWAVAIAAALAFGLGTRADVGSALSALFLVQSWSPDAAVHYAANGVSWTLACEAFFYALFPILVLGLGRLSVTRQRAGFVILPLAVFVIGALPMVFDMGATGNWLVKICPATRLLEFALGILIAFEVARGGWPRLSMRKACAIAVGGYLLAGVTPGTLVFTAPTLIPFALLVGCAAQYERTGGVSVLSRKLFIRLGEWSFAFYLTHQMVVAMTARAIGDRVLSAPAVLALTCVVLAACVTIAWVLFRVVERPMERRLRKSRRSPATVPMPVSAAPAPVPAAAP